MTSAPKTIQEKTTDDERETIVNACGAMADLSSLIFVRMDTAGFWKRRRHIISAVSLSLALPEGEGERLVMMEALALIMSELGEAVEGLRKNAMDDHVTHRPSIAVELADVIIRILDLSAGLGLEVPACVVEKMDYNLSRGAMHGKLA